MSRGHQGHLRDCSVSKDEMVGWSTYSGGIDIGRSGAPVDYT